MTGAGRAAMFDRAFLGVFLAIGILGIATWLAVLQHSYHLRIYRYNKQLTILHLADSELGFNHPGGRFSIWQ